MVHTECLVSLKMDVLVSLSQLYMQILVLVHELVQSCSPHTAERVLQL